MGATTRTAPAAGPKPAKAPQKQQRHPHSHSSVSVASVVTLLGGVLVVAAAILAQRGYRGRDHIIGVDLGTTYSVVAISQRNNVTVIADDDGHLITPSMVAYLPGGKTLLGRAAKLHRTVDPTNTIFNAKRFIGRSHADVEAEAEMDWPYQFQLQSDGSVGDDAEACFAITTADAGGHPNCVTPVDVGTRIVAHLRDLACRFVGHDQINKAVIAVPVDFNSRQRAATIAAFKAAGLQVSRVLEEPTAAAIAYGLHRASSASFILVFDFGGGTLDVSLLYAQAGSINVVDTIGDNHLGGEDIDSVIAKHLDDIVAKEMGEPVPVTSASTRAPNDAKPDEQPCTKSGLRSIAEKMKRDLSSSDLTSATCYVPKASHDRIKLSMSQTEFEELCQPVLSRTMRPVRAVLESNGMTIDDIDEVVLVGGSTRIPWIRRTLQEMFNGRPPRYDIDPDVAVAYGAARTLD